MTSIRFVDVDPDEDLENESPVYGVQDAEDMTLDEACQVAKVSCEQLATWDVELALHAAARAAKRLENKGELAPLLRDEARAVHVYTQDSLFYKELNKRLRLRERENLKPFFPYLKQFLTGLHRLSPVDDTVFRGVKLDLSAKYCQGDDLVWWAFSSATSTAAVLRNDTFLGQVGDRTLFSIKVHRCVNIRRYSAIGNEDERLILSGTAFRVKSNLALGNGLTMIQLEEDVGCPALISGFAFVPSQHSTAKVAQERADAELAKKFQMQLQLQAAGSSPAASSAPSQPPPLSKEAVVETPLQAALAAVKSDASLETMNKLVRNCVQTPGEDKFRKIRLTNEKIAAVLVSVEGAKTAMLKMGWVEDGEFLVLPAGVQLSMKEVRDIEDAKMKLKNKKSEKAGTSTYYNESKLLKAVEKGDTTTVVALLKAGTNVDCHNNWEKWTPLHGAAFNNKHDIAKVLLAHGANVNARDQRKNTPLHQAAANSNHDIAKLLVAHRADVNARNELHNNMPIHLASEYNDKHDIAKVLLAHGADVDARNKWKESTPLHYAAGNNKNDIAKVLLAHGAYVNARNEDGDTPLALAHRRGHREMEALLRQHGGL